MLGFKIPLPENTEQAIAAILRYGQEIQILQQRLDIKTRQLSRDDAGTVNRKNPLNIEGKAHGCGYSASLNPQKL